MDTLKKMENFLSDHGYFDQATIAALVAVSSWMLRAWLNEPDKHAIVNGKVERFLKGDGKALADIRTALCNGACNHTELHQKRAAILKKAKVHQTANQRVPSLTIDHSII